MHEITISKKNCLGKRVKNGKHNKIERCRRVTVRERERVCVCERERERERERDVLENWFTK